MVIANKKAFKSEKTINRLKTYLLENPNVVFAYIFGSFARGKNTSLSDIDIAVYLNNPNRIDYLKLYTEISNSLGRDDLDLIVLNTAPISITGRVIQNRIVLVDKDPARRHAYESLILREFFDFRQRERQILQRRYGIG